MKLTALKHDVELTTRPLEPLPDDWAPDVTTHLQQHHWSLTQVRDRIDLAAWQGFTTDLPRDPYVNRRWKRMSWLCLDDHGEMEVMGDCPMAQGGAFNDAASMADRLRYYAPLSDTFLDRQDVRSFVTAWAKLWQLGPREPILMQINGVRGEGQIDPLQGQGIHADGCQALSMLVISRENVGGGINHLYADKAGTRPLADIILAPGDILHLCDDRLYHSIDDIHQRDPSTPFERFVVIINSRFVDSFQNRILRRHFPDAMLNKTR
jgi:hypothetical protein